MWCVTASTKQFVLLICLIFTSRKFWSEHFVHDVNTFRVIKSLGKGSCLYFYQAPHNYHEQNICNIFINGAFHETFTTSCKIQRILVTLNFLFHFTKCYRYTTHSQLLVRRVDGIQIMKDMLTLVYLISGTAITLTVYIHHQQPASNCSRYFDVLLLYIHKARHLVSQHLRACVWGYWENIIHSIRRLSSLWMLSE